MSVSFVVSPFNAPPPRDVGVDGVILPLDHGSDQGLPRHILVIVIIVVVVVVIVIVIVIVVIVIIVLSPAVSSIVRHPL